MTYVNAPTKHIINEATRNHKTYPIPLPHLHNDEEIFKIQDLG